MLCERMGDGSAACHEAIEAVVGSCIGTPPAGWDNSTSKMSPQVAGGLRLQLSSTSTAGFFAALVAGNGVPSGSASQTQRRFSEALRLPPVSDHWMAGSYQN